MRNIHLPKNSNVSICFFFLSLKMGEKLLKVTIPIYYDKPVFSCEGSSHLTD